jgi:hypothetical protein
MRADNRIAAVKIMKTLRAAISARWVLLFILAYVVFAHYVLGTSCLIASTTGLPCPGCGGSRAFIALFHGEFAESFAFQPMLIPAAVLLAVNFVIWLTHERTPRYSEVMLICLVAAMIAVFAVRMFLMYPNEPPMVFNHRAVIPRIIEFFKQIVTQIA